MTDLRYGTPLKKRPGKRCVTHHYACDCREEQREALEEAVKAAQRLLDGEDEDDLHQSTGLPTEECKRLLALINAVDIGSR